MATGDTDQPNGFHNRAVSAIEKIALRSISTGNFGWFVLLAICIFCIWRLDSQDLKDVILKVLATYGWLGYPVAGITIFISVRVLRWREQFYQREMARIAEVRNTLLQEKLELPLASSVRKDERDKK